MLGYLLFVIPMAAAAFWVGRKHGVRQALLDLIAFNLLFNFDFAALLPGNLQLSLLHLLGIAFAGYELVTLISFSKGWRVSRRTLLVVGATVALMFWLVVANYYNRPWDLVRTTNFIVRHYLLNALFVVVGISVARHNGFARFGKIILFATILVGTISIIQTASGGVLLTNDYSPNYLGIFQPLGDKAVYWRDSAESAIGYVAVVRTIRFGELALYRAPGSFDGAYLSFCLIAIVLFSALISRERVSLWLFVPFVFSLIGFTAAFNRTAIVGFAIMAAFVVIVRFRSLLSITVLRRWLVPAGIAGIIAIAFSGPIVTVVAANIDGLFGSRAGAEVGSLNGRTLLWSYVLPAIAQSPLIGTGVPVTLFRAGWGVETNPDVDVGTHNGFLEYAYRAGIPAAALFIFLLGFCFVQCWQWSRDERLPASERNVFLGLAAAFMGFGALNMTGGPMEVSQVAALFWVLCGFLASYRPKLLEPSEAGA